MAPGAAPCASTRWLETAVAAKATVARTIPIVFDALRSLSGAIRVVPERPYREEFNKKTGVNELVIDVTGNTLGGDGPERPSTPFTTHHMANLINAARGTEKVHFNVEHGYKAMVAIRLGVDSYRSGQTMYFDAKREKATKKPVNTV